MAEEFLPLNDAERDSERSWYSSFASGIASGLIKVPEGVFSLAAELIDLGLDTNTAADVDQFFDKINIFEDAAQDRAIGKLTEAIVQVGVPGTAGFKLANQAARRITAKAVNARRNNAFVDFKKTKDRTALKESLNKARDLNKNLKYPRFAVGVMGGATGETFVADVENIGTFGDMFEGGPTQLDREDSFGREDAARKLANRLKFGSESLFITPVVAGVGKSAKLLAQRGKELAYSDSTFARWLDKYVRAPFSPRGGLTEELFGAEKLKQALISKDTSEAKNIVRDLTREIDAIYPEAERLFGRTNVKERDQFLVSLNEALFEGDLRNPLNKDALDKAIKIMDKVKLPEERKGAIINAMNNAREQFTSLIDILDKNAQGVQFKEGKKQLQQILSSRTANWIGTTYRIFEDQNKGILKIFGSYRPTAEIEEKAIGFFKKIIAESDPTLATKPNQLEREAVIQVKSLLNSVKNLKNPKTLDLNKYIAKTIEGKPGGDILKKIIDDTNMLPEELRTLLGEIKDPRYSIFNAMTNLSSVARTASYLSAVSAKNKEVQAAGGRGFFWANKEAGESALRSRTTGIELVPVDEIVKDLPGAGTIVNPLSGQFTTREIAEAIKNANNIAGGLQGFVRGEGKEGAEAAVSWVYRNLLLFPKGISQMSKTIFSVPTHLRNMLSAFGFSGANGILFENPELLKKAFAEGIDVSGLFTKAGANSPRARAAYNELLELGLVNSQVQIGDLKALLTDVRLGEQVANMDSILSPFMRKMKGVKEFFQGKYVAEDDTFKITNYVVELDRLKRQVANGRAVNRNIIQLPEDELVARFNNATKNGFKGNYDQFVDEFALKTEAANIVKNTVPNYDFVGSAVRTARLLPIGNFMSFPSEMIRTTSNIVSQGLKEMRHVPAKGVRIKGSNLGTTVIEILEDGTERIVKNNAITSGSYGTGIKRLMGMATFTTAVPVALTEGAAAIYDVSREEIDALRRFVPEWSKNSTLIPIKDEDGELRYIDFSHSNAYDIIARPLRTVVNSIQEGELTDEQVLSGFARGIGEAGSEIMNPFISESIWTEAVADLTIRNGLTEDGKRLYTDQTSFGDKRAIEFLHLGNALLPSFRQYDRLIKAATEAPTERGETLNVGPEILGFMGLRPIKVNPLDSMGYKIADYQQGIRNARREFTGGYFGLLKGGPVDPNDIIKRFALSNNARFNVEQNMYKDLNAAEILGVSRNVLSKEFKNRQISEKNFTNLRSGRFDPYVPSADIEEKFAEVARNLGDTNAYLIAKPQILRMINDMRRIGLNSKFLFNTDERLLRAEGGMVEESSNGLDINDYLIPEVQTPPLPMQPMPNASVILSQASGNNVMTNGLTPTENALLSEEEKIIRLRQRGLA
jgi:hypothetical protein